jgi:hypothetical protein
VAATDPPKEGGWWDDFVEYASRAGGNIASLGGLNPGVDSMVQRGVSSYLKKTGENFQEQIVDPIKENPRQWFMEQIGPGNLVGMAGKSAAKAAVRPVMARLLRELAKEGGATLEASGERFAGKGFAVADPALTTIVSKPAEMKAFLKRRDVLNALDAGKRIGKWTDPETGKTEINITEILEDEKAAQKLAASRGEQALGSFGEGGEYLGDVRNPHAPVNAVKDLLAGLRQNEPMRRISEIPSTRGKQLADAYEGLPKNDPAAREAYDALNAEVEQQMKAMQDAGYKIEFVDKDPYANSADMMKDVRENKTLKVFKTPEGGEFHPYMTADQNNRFRAVHDFLAHAGGGNQFGAVGEENAYRVHSSTLSRLAQRALASETRGQNSWVNFGPESHRPVKERPFAEQKAAMFPENMLDDYEQMGAAPHTPVEPERIVSASSRLKNKPLTKGGPDRFDGVTHGDAFDKYVASPDGQFRKKHGVLSHDDLDEGFLTTTGRWVSRDEALPIAKAHKQWTGLNRMKLEPSGQPGLMSEALTGWADPSKRVNIRINNDWKRTDRGVFDYSPEGGVPATEYREPADLPFKTEARPRAGATELAEQIATDPRVEKRIISDMEKGLPLGGRGWYGLLPLRRYFESRQGPISFADFNMAGAAGSARTPTHNELTNASILMYAKKHGISSADAKKEFLKKFPGTMRPTFMGMHGKIFDRAQQLGYAAPKKSSEGTLKIPNYFHNRMLKATGVPIDTHEMRSMAQALGIDEEDLKAALVDADSYNLAAEPYRRVAKRFGLHEDQVQAGRWIGGGKQTGLKSQPKGDFMQTLEDGLLYTAKRRGLDESPRGLRSLWDAIAGGDDFFLPFRGEGGFPVY